MPQLINLILGIRFSGKTPLVKEDNRSKFIEEVTGQSVPPPPNMPQQGVSVNHNPSKTRAILQENNLLILVELEDEDSAKQRLFTVLSRIYSDFPYKNNSIIRIGVQTRWMQEWNSSFTNLVAKYKDIFYKENSLISEASDVAVTLTLKDENAYKINFASGPMKPEQGKGLSVFGEIDFPHDFIMVDIDRFSETNLKEINSVTEIKKLVTASIIYGKTKAEQTVQLLTE